MPRGFYALVGWLAWQVATWWVRRRVRALRTPALVGTGVLVAGGAAFSASRRRRAR